MRYVIVWAVLVALTAATFLLAKMDLGPFSLPVALAIATTKSALVALIFMHLSHHPGTLRLTLITGVVFVLLLGGLTVADVATRLPSARPNAPGVLQAP